MEMPTLSDRSNLQLNKQEIQRKPFVVTEMTNWQTYTRKQMEEHQQPNKRIKCCETTTITISVADPANFKVFRIRPSCSSVYRREFFRLQQILSKDSCHEIFEIWFINHSQKPTFILIGVLLKSFISQIYEISKVLTREDQNSATLITGVRYCREKGTIKHNQQRYTDNSFKQIDSQRETSATFNSFKS